ncbi:MULTISPECIES: magnesium transporter CorA family protein [Fusobacterium]|uniref:magnesium transporter CorA family protein n=1 Tax=Fusobacterium TaxID=848 RepID=UPI00147704C0|nr:MULTISPECIES: magnesium transporter CorA family protein [Fusobacterium]NME35197.1 magnesium transporter CorA family protein [Fusobacterium sp. FSA-380-WT-3A]
MIQVIKTNEKNKLDYLYYKTDDDDIVNYEILREKNTWINLTAPTDEEIEALEVVLDIPQEHLRAALDEEEKSRLEIDGDIILVIIDIPIHNDGDDKCSFTTIPLGIILLPDNIITITIDKFPLIDEFIKGKVKEFFTYKKTRFILQLLFRNTSYYLYYLRQIGRVSDVVESRLKKNLDNDELMLLLELEKSLVYFTTSLKSNEAVLDRIMRMQLVKKYPDDMELLDDIIIDTKQAIEMASIYTSVLSSTRDAFSTIMSNNLNNVMKRLTSITVVLAVPTIISGIWGMNVLVPFGESNFGFLSVIVISIVLSFLIALWLSKNKML